MQTVTSHTHGGQVGRSNFTSWLTIFVFLRAAQECGEYSATSAWTSEIFTAPNMMFGQEVRNLDPLKVNYIFPGEASRPCGDGPHQGQAPVQGAFSNYRFCKGLFLYQRSFYLNYVLCSQIGIPTVGLVDTDCNPNLITYPVPGNDDSQDSVQIFLNLTKQAVMAGKEKRKLEQQQ